MTISDLSLLAVALLIVLYRGWCGWRLGATSELRHVITNLFGVLFAIRFWQPCAETVISGVMLDPRWITTGAFVALFMVGAAVAGFAVRLGAQVYRSVKADPVNRGLGVLSGAFSGALLGGSLLWLATVANPDQFANASAAREFARFPQDIMRGLESAVARVNPNGPGRVRFPAVALTQVPVEAKPGTLPEGVALMQVRGEVTWR
jgi:uncharacterized membrane protein required for colicin V production